MRQGSREGQIRINNRRVSADLKNIPLLRVIREIREQTNIWFKGDESLFNENISLQFKDLSLEDSLKRIIKNYDYSFLYDGDGKLAGLMVLSKTESRRNVSFNAKSDKRSRMFKRSVSTPVRVRTEPSVQAVSNERNIHPTGIPQASPFHRTNGFPGDAQGISHRMKEWMSGDK